MALNMGDDHVLRHAGTRHVDDVAHGDGARLHRVAQSGFDQRPVIGFGLVDGAADGRSADRTDAGSDQAPTTGWPTAFPAKAPTPAPPTPPASAPRSER